MPGSSPPTAQDSLKTARRAATTPHVITLVHGTWARKARWTRNGSALITTLQQSFSEVILPSPFPWSGRNSVGARYRAAVELRKHLHGLLRTYPPEKYSHFVVGHSH